MDLLQVKHLFSLTVKATDQYYNAKLPMKEIDYLFFFLGVLQSGSFSISCHDVNSWHFRPYRFVDQLVRFSHLDTLNIRKRKFICGDS